MDNSLLILLRAKIDEALSTKDINAQIKQIATKIDALKLKFDVDDSIVGYFKNISDNIKSIIALQEQQNSVESKHIQLITELDGSTKRIEQQYKKNGEIVQTVTERINKQKQAVSEESDQVKKLVSDYTNLGDKIKQVSKKDSSGNTINGSEVFKNKNTTTTLATDSQGNVVSETTIKNLERERVETEKLSQSKKDLLRQTQELARSGGLTKNELADLAKSINTSQNSRDIDLAVQKYKELVQIQNAYLKNQRDNTRVDVRNDATARQLEIYKQQAAIKAQNLQSSNLGKSVDSTELEKYLHDVQALTATTPNLRNEMQQLGTRFQQIEADARTARGSVSTFREQLTNALSNVGVYFGAAAAIQQTIQWFKDGISYVNEFNKTLTLISTISNKTQDNVESLGRNYQQTAANMGTVTSEFTKGAAEFYRMGLTDNEVMDRLKTSTQYAKISGFDMAQSAEILTAATNSMHVSIQKASDTYTLLGDSAATSAQEIGTSFQKVGGTAGALNLSFDKVASWITEISARTRESAETVGNSVKSILARVQSLREKGFDEEDGTQVNQVAKALSTVGIQLVNQQGQFRDFGTVLDELGTKWKDLDSRHKAYLATTVAG